MNITARSTDAAAAHHQRGYVLVLFAIVLAFTGIMAAMQVLTLTSVATTSRAFDLHRQRTTGTALHERLVTEALLDQCQIAAADPTTDLAGSLARHTAALFPDPSAAPACSELPALPKLTTFPDATTLPDPLTAIPDEARSLLTPELALLMGDQAAVYPETRFGFEREVPALAGLVRERTEVRARLFSVPLSRFGVVAYDLPAEIGLNPGPALRAISDAPAGLVAARDGASRSDLAQGATSLPYHYRRRASVAAAYQYVFSQRYVDRVAEYAGVSHYCDLDAAPSSTAVLAGMSTSGPASQWDLAAAGRGTYGTISLFRDAAVVFTEQPGRSLHLHDSGSAANTTPLLVLVLGPSDTRAGSLALRISSVARPVVLVGYNVNVQVDDGTSVNGAIFLDPASSLAATGTMRVGHLSYWAGSPSVTAAAVVAGAMPASAAALAPRVVFIATAASRS